MKPKTLAILALLVAALGAFVWFGRELPSSDERAELERRVLTLEAEEVNRLAIERQGGRVVFERDPAAREGDEEVAGNRDWSLVEPIRAPADSTRVDGLVDRLVRLERERTLEDVDRAAVGLTEPRAEIRLETAGGEEVLEVGAEIPASSNMMLARRGEESVHVVAAAIWSDLTSGVDEWRDKRLFSAGRDAVESIRLIAESGEVELVHRQGEFHLASPVEDRADTTHANGLLTSLTGLRAARFVPASEAEGLDTGLDEPLARVEVTLGGEPTPWTLAIGRVESDEEGAARFAEIGGEVVTLQADLLTPALRPAAEWRSKELVAGEVYELDRLEIEDARGVTELRREGSDWTRDGEVIDFAVATDLLYAVSGGTASRIVDANTVGEPGEPVLTFRLIPEADEAGEVATETLRLYTAREGETPARVSGRQALLMLSPETVADLEEKLEAVRSAAPETAEDATAEAPVEDGDA